MNKTSLYYEKDGDKSNDLESKERSYRAAQNHLTYSSSDYLSEWTRLNKKIISVLCKLPLINQP